MKQLIAYLLDHAMLDFSGELTIDMVKEFLRDEDSPESRALLSKMTEGVVGEQLKLFAES